MSGHALHGPVLPAGARGGEADADLSRLVISEPFVPNSEKTVQKKRNGLRMGGMITKRLRRGVLKTEQEERSAAAKCDRFCEAGGRSAGGYQGFYSYGTIFAFG